MKRIFSACLPLLFFFTACAQPTDRQQQKREDDFLRNGSWANYGNDPGGMRYSPLKEINRDNVKDLKTAWTYQSGELKNYEGTDLASKAALETTPIMVEGVLYLSTPTNRVIALDAGTGKELWVYDPHINLHGNYSEVTCRGVSKWIDASVTSGKPGHKRIYVATIDGRLIALEATTGQPIPSFGTKGIVDLKQGVGPIQVTSPPAVIGNLVILGSTMGDNGRIEYPPGVVRAFDARSGTLVWSWDPIPRKDTDPGADSWQGSVARKTGAANAWAPLSVDLARDLVFVPTTSPAVDYYGGERIGNNDYANSIVAIRASTGKVVWHFQAVHHDLWDYDIPAQPLLTDIQKNGKKIPAVIISTKMGHLFVLNRETGEHLFPVEEKPVAASTVPGEKAAATQPFPTQLPLLGLRSVTTDDAWGPTPEFLQQARDRISQHVNEGIFTPPSLQGSMMTPSNVGGMNWSGSCFDPETNILVTNVNRLAALITLFPKSEYTRQSVNTRLPRAELAQQEGTPYIMSREYLFTIEDGQFLMQTKPPWGTLAAVDLNTGQLKWEVPLGIMMDPRKYPEAIHWGSINLGGSIVTSGGLVFISSTMDNMFRAFDIRTGEIRWQTQLPAGGQATPMTYEWKGKQYVVIAAGGHGKLGTKLGDYIMAYSL